MSTSGNNEKKMSQSISPLESGNRIAVSFKVGNAVSTSGAIGGISKKAVIKNGRVVLYVPNATNETRRIKNILANQNINNRSDTHRDVR